MTVIDAIHQTLIIWTWQTRNATVSKTVKCGSVTHRPCHFNSKIAQLVEHSVVTRKVGGSLPSLGANFKYIR